MIGKLHFYKRDYSISHILVQVELFTDSTVFARPLCSPGLRKKKEYDVIPDTGRPECLACRREAAMPEYEQLELFDPEPFRVKTK